MNTKERIDKFDNEELSRQIDRYVRGEIARAMLKRQLIDEVLVESIADEFYFSKRATERILKRAREQLLSRI